MEKINIDPYGEEDWDEVKIVPVEIIESVKNCKLVKRGYERNGHDCWGNLEWSSYKYVTIKGKEQRCWDDWYVVHDGKKVKRIMSKFIKELNEKKGVK